MEFASGICSSRVFDGMRWEGLTEKTWDFYDSLKTCPSRGDQSQRTTNLKLVLKAINYYFLANITNRSHGFTVSVAKLIWNSERAFVCMINKNIFYNCPSRAIHSWAAAAGDHLARSIAKTVNTFQQTVSVSESKGIPRSEFVSQLLNQGWG